MLRLAIVSALASLLSTSACAKSIYQIGNSLTWDSAPLQMASTAAAAGETITSGYHILWGSSLQTIVSRPTQSDIAPVPEYGRFRDALPQHAWDYVTLQSYYGQGSTLGTDITAAQALITLTRYNRRNAGTQFYLYQSWPHLTAWGPWEEPVLDELSQPTVNQRDYFRTLLAHVRETEPGALMAPVAEVLYRIREEISQGNIVGIASFDQLYIDAAHMSHDLGRFVANATVATTILRQDLTGNASAWSIDSAVRDQLTTIIWDVVKHHPDAGISQTLLPGDYDGNGSVNAADLPVWKSNFASTIHLAADGNHDGRIDAADYTVWRDAFSQGVGLGDLTATPEPSSVALAALTLLAASAIRKPPTRNVAHPFAEVLSGARALMRE
jgi:hypothetical protein